MSNYKVIIKRRIDDNSMVTWDDLVTIGHKLRNDSGFQHAMVMLEDANVIDCDGDCEGTTFVTVFTIINSTVKHDSRRFAESLNEIREKYGLEILAVTL